CLVKLPMNDTGELEISELDALITTRTKLIAVTQVSNALGTINPVKRIIEMAHASNIPVLIDGAQAVQHLPVDMQDLDCDFYVFSGHKMYGPTGIGVLYGKREWLDKLPPYQGGGEMISHVSFERSEYNELPFKFEAGTPDYVGIAALGAAIDFLNQVGIKHIAQHEEELLRYTMQLLEPLDTLRFIGTARQKCSVISFLAGKSHPYDVGVLLDQLGIAVRTGTHCAETVMQHFAIPGTARISFGLYNTADEVETLARGLTRVVKML
ncbi:MAG TPA: cysteine desulfurase, partial [Bacteroidales bacterium]|nr:cysteine desulfurase [Bacteroidales bacterium]